MQPLRKVEISHTCNLTSSTLPDNIPGTPAANWESEERSKQFESITENSKWEHSPKVRRERDLAYIVILLSKTSETSASQNGKK
jgi:hypothetical protein